MQRRGYNEGENTSENDEKAKQQYTFDYGLFIWKVLDEV